MPRPRHIHEIYIRTTPDRLWQALTDPTFTEQYYNRCRFEATVAAGEPYAYRFEGAPAVDGVIEEAEPFRRLVMTFHIAFDEVAAAEPPSRVTWEIAPVGDVCRLTIVHGDLFGSPRTYQITATGWQPILSSLKSLLETGEALPDVPDDRAGDEEPPDLERQLHRDQGIDANNLTYTLLDQADRSPADDARLLHTAHAAAYHWDLAGTDVNRARSEYLCSRVYAFVGRGEPARYHAERCLALVEANGLTDFDLAYANEAMARALAASGQPDEAAGYLAAARATEVADAEDREIVEADLAAGPWYGLT